MNILIGVTGSIAAYKAYDLVRLYVKNGHNIKVVLTKGGAKFIKKETFQYLGARDVFLFDDDYKLGHGQNGVRHIDLLKWADQLIIAPASANTLAKFANGLCDDLLSSIFLARSTTPCFIFPAMNTGMLLNPITQKNIKILKELSNIYIHPTTNGDLACGDEGIGKLADIEDMELITSITSFHKTKRKVVITTGATISPLDPVRYLTNPSSGLTGYELAKEFIKNGDDVVLIYGANCSEKIFKLKNIENVDLIQAKTTLQMHQVVTHHFKDCDIYISAAAISDIEFNHSEEKIKKASLQESLPFNKATDVLASVLKDRVKQKVVSFAAETSSNSDIFKEKWQRKKVDLLIGNIVHSGHNREQQGFAQNENEYFFIQNAQIVETHFLSKQQLAKKIYQFIN